MSDVEEGITEHLRQQELRAEHRASGLWDDTLLERYATRQDLVAFVDETHRATSEGDAAYYALSAVVFHADDLPRIRGRLEDIAGGTFWHSKEAARNPQLRDRIAEMNKYIGQEAAKPAIVFDVRDHEIGPSDERGARDVCLGQALRYLDEQGIGDVVLDQFARIEQHNVQLDQAVLSSLRASGEVDSEMWMHHARMSEEHALWSADTVAWSVQRHYFGQRDWDSKHLAPLRGRLEEIHAQTGAARTVKLPEHAELAGPDGRRARTAPIHSLARQVEKLRAASQRPAAQPASEESAAPAVDLDVQKAPPVAGPEGPSRSL